MPAPTRAPAVAGAPALRLLRGPNSLAGQLQPWDDGSLALAVQQASVRLVSCLWWRETPPWVILERRIPDTLVLLPVAGACIVHSPAGDELLRPGSVALFPEGAPHALDFAPGCARFDVFAVHSRIHDANGMPLLRGAPEGGPPPGHVLPLPGHREWVRRCMTLAALRATDLAAGDALGAALVRLLLCDLVRGGLVLTQDRVPDPALAPALAAVAADPGARHTIGALAARCGLGPRRFRQRLRAILGVSPKRWLDEARLVRAAVLLRTTDLPVAKVAAAIGFSSVRQFQHRFQERHGLPPGPWRSRAASGP